MSHLISQAEINNPDAKKYYPIIIHGIHELKERFDKQQIEIKSIQEHIKKIDDILHTINNTNSKINNKFSSLKIKQIQIFQKLLSLLRKIEVLRCRGVPMESSEIR